MSVYNLRYLLVFCLTLLVKVVFSQPSDDIDKLPPWQLLKRGKNYEKAGDKYAAIEYYGRFYIEKPEHIEVAHVLAKLYLETRNYEKAMNYYLRCYISDPRYVECLYYYAVMLKMMGDYEKALEHFKIFQERYKGRELKDVVKDDIASCELSMKLVSDSINVVISHLGPSINKAHIEFSPVQIDDSTVLFAALRVDSVDYYYQDDEFKPVRQFYRARKRGGEWVFQEPLPGPFNQQKFHVGNGAFSADGTRFYFSRCEIKWVNKPHCSIYKSERDFLERWSEPELISAIEDATYSSTQPTVGIDNKKNQEVIYFASNRSKGRGGWDIWYSVYNKRSKSFDPPRNAGKKINTEGDEVTPYYDLSKHRLYFSSNFLPGLGGFDVFKSTGQLNKWVTPVNMGYPLNKSTDDTYFTVSKDNDEGFFTSNRVGSTPLLSSTCCDDIYHVVLLDNVIIPILGSVYEILDNVSEEEAKTKQYTKLHPLESAIVYLYVMDVDMEDPVLVTTDTTDEQGNYSFNLENEVNYKIVAGKEGYFTNRDLFSTYTVDITQTHHIKPLGIKKFEEKKAIKLNNIYYEYDKSNLTKEAEVSIDTTLLVLLKESLDLLIEISSHTDDKGTDSYNVKLSQKRAESVVNYLVSKGIEEGRLIPKGYGESLPIAPNSNKDGSDNPDGRAKNRRTEFKVMGAFESKSDS